ncbi:MAG: hypothetical protein DMF81_16480, partial [Acidobacteria bacterium]
MDVEGGEARLVVDGLAFQLHRSPAHRAGHAGEVRAGLGEAHGAPHIVHAVGEAAQPHRASLDLQRAVHLRRAAGAAHRDRDPGRSLAAEVAGEERYQREVGRALDIQVHRAVGDRGRAAFHREVRSLAGQLELLEAQPAAVHRQPQWGAVGDRVVGQLQLEAVDERPLEPPLASGHDTERSRQGLQGEAQEGIQARPAGLDADIRLVGREKAEASLGGEVHVFRAAFRFHRQAAVARAEQARVELAHGLAPQGELRRAQPRLQARPFAWALDEELAGELPPPMQLGRGRRQQLPHLEGRDLRRPVVDAVVAEAPVEA